MSNVNVRSIQALADLKASLSQFAATADQSMQAIDLEIQRTQQWLEERQRYWQREVTRIKAEVRRAEVELARCQASGYRDDEGNYHEPNCSGPDYELASVKLELEDAVNQSRTVEQWTKQVQQAVQSYRAQARQLSRATGLEIAKATTLLERKIATLQTYAATSGPSGIGPGVASFQRRVSRGRSFENWERSKWNDPEHEVVEFEAPSSWKGKAGRIDIRLIETEEGNTVLVEMKASDWDRMAPHRVRPNALRHARQLWRYIKAERSDWPDRQVIPALVYSNEPDTPGRKEEIENVLEQQHIQVVWRELNIDDL